MRPEDIEMKKMEFEKRKEAVKWAHDICVRTSEFSKENSDDKFWNWVRELEDYLENGQIPENEVLASDG